MGTVRRHLRRLARRVLVVAAVVLALAVGDAALLYRRLERLPFSAPPNRPGTTYLLLGSDSRAFIATGGDRARFGSVPGERADVVLVLHVPTSGEPVLLAVPRDLLVFSDTGVPRRLNVTMLGVGAQGTSDALCRSLGIAVDHVAVIGFNGFRRLVDSVGGVDVSVETPVRDTYTGLDLETVGRHRLDGDQALAYVRSRHPESRVSNHWTPANDGAATRPDRAGAVVRAVGARARRNLLNPLATQQTAWALTSSVRVDETMDALEILHLARALTRVQQDAHQSVALPAETSSTPVPVAEIAAGADDVLRRVGVTSLPISPPRCTPALLTARRVPHVSLPADDGQ